MWFNTAITNVDHSKLIPKSSCQRNRATATFSAQSNQCEQTSNLDIIHRLAGSMACYTFQHAKKRVKNTHIEREGPAPTCSLLLSHWSCCQMRGRGRPVRHRPATGRWESAWTACHVKEFFSFDCKPPDAVRTRVERTVWAILGCGFKVRIACD